MNIQTTFQELQAVINAIFELERKVLLESNKYFEYVDDFIRLRRMVINLHKITSN